MRKIAVGLIVTIVALVILVAVSVANESMSQSKISKHYEIEYPSSISVPLMPPVPARFQKKIHQEIDTTPALAGLLEPAQLQPCISTISIKDIGFEVTMTDDVAIPMYDIGKPMVPYIVKWYKIPTNSDVESVTVNLSGPIEIHNIFIEPVPEPPRAEYMIDNETYSSNEPYPGKEYEYRLTGDPIRGKGVVVWIFPIQYIPAESRIVACRNASISIVYRVPAGEGEK
jgi:hypothetical protein